MPQLLQGAFGTRPQRTRRPTSPPELVGAILGYGEGHQSAERGARVLAAMGGLRGLSRLGPRELARRSGVPLDDCERLSAGVRLGQLCCRSERAEQSSLVDIASVCRWASSRFAYLDHEELWVLSVDSQLHLVAEARVAQGGTMSLHTRVRDVLHRALADGATGLILVHNHPAGDLSPSPEDRRFTECVRQACCVVGIGLVDHVVVTRTGDGVSVLSGDTHTEGAHTSKR